MNVRNWVWAAVVAGLTVGLSSAPASAQVAVGTGVGFGSVPYVGYGSGYGSPYGYGGYGLGYFGGGTAAGNYLQGRAAVIQSQGQYNYYTSLAAKEWAEARAKELENDSTRARTFWDLRRLNDLRRAEERPAKVTPTQLAKFAHDGAPDRLAGHQFDQPTGVILWPETLQGPAFDAPRNELDKLFGQRVPGNHGVGSPLYQGVVRAVADMKATLKDQIRTLDPTEYLAARKFLDSLAYESRFAPQGTVALR